MSTELERHRDYMRDMAAGGHTPACVIGREEAKQRWGYFVLFRDWPTHWGDRPSRRPEPCDGTCVTDTDRALWARLAAEIDNYLAGDDEPLWEDA